LLLVVPKPVDRLLMPVDVEVDRLLMPVDVDVDRLTRRLLVVLSPVDRLLMPVDVEVDRLPMLVEVEVDSRLIAELVAKSWLPLTASVEVAFSRPAATLVICRVAPPSVPTLTTPTGAVAPVAPAKVYAVPPIVAPEVGAAALVFEPSPSATLRAVEAMALAPMATPLVEVTWDRFPSATALVELLAVFADAPIAMLPVLESETES